jgi:hypothetical protein
LLSGKLANLNPLPNSIVDKREQREFETQILQRYRRHSIPEDFHITIRKLDIYKKIIPFYQINFQIALQIYNLQTEYFDQAKIKVGRFDDLWIDFKLVFSDKKASRN